MGHDGGEALVAFSATKDWTASSSASWCELSKTSGSSSESSFTVSVEPNPDYEDRSCTITIKSEGLSASVSVNQATGQGLIISPKSVNISNAEQEVLMTVNHNIDFEVVIAEEYASWVSFVQTKSLQSSTVKFLVVANELYDSRSAKITVRSKDASLSDMFTINQGENFGLFIEPSKYSVSCSSQTLTAQINANVEYNAISNDDWIRVTSSAETKGLSKSELILEIDANQSYGLRQGSVSVKQKDGELSGTIAIKQSPLEALVLYEQSKTLSYEAQSFTIEVGTNIGGEEVAVSIPAEASSWLSYLAHKESGRTSEDGLTIYNYIFEVTENGSEPRSADITFANESKNLSASVKITQEAQKDLKPMLLKITGKTIDLPLNGEIDCVIDWGDGNVEQCTKPFPSHTYTDGKEYHTISVLGKVSKLNPANKTDGIVEVVSWGLLEGLTELEWAFYGQQLEKVADDEFGCFSNVTTFSGCFQNCAYLSSIPSGLFKHARNARYFSSVFSGCSTLSAIPNGLFDNCEQATNFANAFNYCRSLLTVPSRLFSKNNKVEDYSAVFQCCTNLKSIGEAVFENATNARDFGFAFNECFSLETIPSDIFKDAVNALTFEGVFDSCRSIKSIPNGLFDNCTEVDIFASAFAYCYSLKTTPEYLFTKNTKATYFGSVFYACEALESIGKGLFDNCISASYFKQAFASCTALKEIPDALFHHCVNAEYFEGAFGNCTSLYKIGERVFDNCASVIDVDALFSQCISLETVPVDLFEDMVQLTKCYYTFKECTNLKSVPEMLFAKNTQLTSLEGIFRNCYSLTTIPEKLLSNCPKLKNLSYFCDGCIKLESIPEKLFASCPEITSISSSFCGCYSLKAIPTSLFDNNKKIDNYSSAFNGCDLLTGESPYTMLDGVKVHLYERSAENGFVDPYSVSLCFRKCTGLEDYESIPKEWK